MLFLKIIVKVFFWVLMIALMTILVTEFWLCPTQMFLSEQGHNGSRDEEVCSCGSAWHPSDLNSYLQLCFPLASRVLTTVKFSIVFGLLKDAQLFRYLIRPTPICSIPPLLPGLISRGLILDKLIFVFVDRGWGGGKVPSAFWHKSIGRWIFLQSWVHLWASDKPT